MLILIFSRRTLALHNFTIDRAAANETFDPELEDKSFD